MTWQGILFATVILLLELFALTVVSQMTPMMTLHMFVFVAGVFVCSDGLGDVSFLRENRRSGNTLSAVQNASILVTMHKYMGLNDVVFQGRPDHSL